MFRLYGQMGLSYPPIFNQRLASNGATVTAYQFLAIGSEAALVSSKKKNRDGDEDEDEDEDEDREEEEVKDLQNEEQAKALEAEVEKIQHSLKALGVDAAGFDDEEKPEQEGGEQLEQLEKVV
jgi:uncharacterized protein YlxW (UPF0749 family)